MPVVVLIQAAQDGKALADKALDVVKENPEIVEKLEDIISPSDKIDSVGEALANIEGAIPSEN